MGIGVQCDAGGRHELVFRFGWGGAVYDCENCDFILDPINALDLLNAAMKLTADEAEGAAKEITRLEYPVGPNKYADILMQFARTWRGETDG